MPNIATVLKLEIARVARKELRAQTDGLKKTVHALRAEVSALKRRVQGLEQELRKTSRAPARQPAPPADADAADGKGLRFTAKGLASNRRRLALSAEDYGLLVGASGQSVYGWESGKTQPRAKQLPAIAALRSVGKKEVAARLAELRQK
jgi:DNA-binding transcriptional regulator YiaG